MCAANYGSFSTLISPKLFNWESFVRNTSQPASIAAARWSASARPYRRDWLGEGVGLASPPRMEAARVCIAAVRLTVRRFGP